MTDMTTELTDKERRAAMAIITALKQFDAETQQSVAAIGRGRRPASA